MVAVFEFSIDAEVFGQVVQPFLSERLVLGLAKLQMISRESRVDVKC